MIHDMQQQEQRQNDIARMRMSGQCNGLGGQQFLAVNAP
jgi:hypothetical protein